MPSHSTKKLLFLSHSNEPKKSNTVNMKKHKNILSIKETIWLSVIMLENKPMEM
jgi:hypothetical protein